MAHTLDSSLLLLVILNYAFKVPHGLADVRRRLADEIAASRTFADRSAAYVRAYVATAICVSPTAHYVILLAS